METFDLVLLIASIFAGAVASISGFGIGSLLTPLLALQFNTKLAIALVSIPHFVATFLRFWILRGHIDKKVLINFGILSALGGLLGAFLNSQVQVSTLNTVFGLILIFAGFTGVTELNKKFHFGHKTAWLAGTLSGLLGGMVGNQGGIRSAALLGFNITPTCFVATATAVGVIVDLVRMPIYFSHYGSSLLDQKLFLIVSVIGVVIGTFAGVRVLKNIPENTFKRMVSALVLILGIFMLCL